MKQVININFQGRVVPIEASAFDKLKEYTESLSRYFEGEDGKDEIINDIENRIGELFQERLKAGATCITEEDVQAIIRNMGRPEDFESDEGAADTAGAQNSSQAKKEEPHFNQQTGPKKLFRDENDKVIGGVCSGLANYFGIDVVVVRIIFVILAISFGFGIIPYLVLWIAVPSSATTEIGSLRKKLYRDNDNKLVAGVCSGLGNYFGINAWIPRVLFLLPFLSFALHDSDFHFFRFGFSPGALIVYIILWMVLPEAITTSEKLEMKGEKVDMNSIKNSIREEMQGLHERVQKFGKEAGEYAQEKGKSMGAEMSTAARRGGNSFGNIISLLFKIVVYFILGCVGFGVLVALFALAIFSIGIFPLKDFVLTDGWQNILAWGTLLFFIAVPIIGILTWVIRRIARARRNNKLLSGSFIALWVIGWICFFALISLVGRDFSSLNHYKEQNFQLANPMVQKLEITAVNPETRIFKNSWLRFEPFEGISEDTVYVKNIDVQIAKSPNDSFKVTMVKLARGNSRRSADLLAQKIELNIHQQDSLLILDRGIEINKHDKFRNQKVILTIFVPVGKMIRVDKSIGWSNNIRFEGPWNGDWDVDVDDVESDWDVDKDYIMKADGLYELNGQPARNRKNGHNNWNNNPDWDNQETATPADENQTNINTAPGGNSVNEPKDPQPVQPPMPPVKPDMNKVKDSLQKEKEKIDKQIQQLGERRDKSQSVLLYSLAAYNPLLMR